jgi:hypothetical protein
VCPSNSYDANANCITCHQTCATCTGTANTNCLTCKSNGWLNVLNSCQCNNAFYMDAQGTARPATPAASLATQQARPDVPAAPSTLSSL